MKYPTLKFTSNQSISIEGKTSTEGADKAARIIATGKARSLVIVSIGFLFLASISALQYIVDIM